jgi:hypothetical protein
MSDAAGRSVQKLWSRGCPAARVAPLVEWACEATSAQRPRCGWRRALPSAAAVRCPDAAAQRELWWRRRESNPRPGIVPAWASTRVSRGLGLVPAAPASRLRWDQPPWVLVGSPRGAASRPARCWRHLRAAGDPSGDGGLETRPREKSCWQVSAVPRGLQGPRTPGAQPGSARNRSRPVRPRVARPV